jgi:solute carrier family 31 (copper transporter), member 1
MDMGGHGMGPPPAAGGMPAKRKHYMHMTFYWGWKSEILFPGWPGARGGMYALALVAVFALAVVLEFLGSRGLESRLPSGRRAAGGAARAAVHAVRMGVAYVLMLALMSFNVGVLLAAVAGHAVGYLAFRARLCGDRRTQVEDGFKEEPAPAACC